MDDDFIRKQIESLEARTSRDDRTIVRRMLTTSWPGGIADRAEPVAMRWLRQWRPATANLVLPACSCPGGHCALCN
jgi:hypothetical protein